jgi:hypothetical protein
MKNFINQTRGPFANRRWLILIVASLLLLAIGSLLVTRECGSGTSVKEVDNLIQENLPPGSSANEIFDFLDAQQIEHARRVGRPSEYGELSYPGTPDISGNAGIIRALVRDERIFSNRDIQIFFILDEQQELTSHFVREVFTDL